MAKQCDTTDAFALESTVRSVTLLDQFGETIYLDISKVATQTCRPSGCVVGYLGRSDISCLGGEHVSNKMYQGISLFAPVVCAGGARARSVFVPDRGERPGRQVRHRR